MVYFYSSQPLETQAPYLLMVGKNKDENDLLIKYGFKEQNMIWFHTDKYSSAHIYLKQPAGEKALEDIPAEVLNDCLQLCKAKSIQGNKMAQCSIICTPWTNLRKSGYMKAGEVSFKSKNRVRRLNCYARDNAVLNRIEKTRLEVEDNVGSFLHTAKKSKNGEYLLEYLEQNSDSLREEEKLRRIVKKQAKKKKAEASEEDDFQ
ncbi:LAMI_0G16292g1_1 [Lachancea mirantina]|uniref:LAMI_0G16292g1_1 n=1 Tax=Lachancea mirantina TaxID=1230905 RepID=A0A1G4KCK9_9SACH|nr:LAMI_0G16292g1_1 [Lachancea mirantina]